MLLNLAFVLLDALALLLLVGGFVLSILRLFNRVPGVYILETILLGAGGILLWIRHLFP